MKTSRSTNISRLFFTFFALLSLIVISGCFNASPDDQELPWSRPADWETNVPGFGG